MLDKMPDGLKALRLPSERQLGTALTFIAFLVLVLAGWRGITIYAQQVSAPSNPTLVRTAGAMLGGAFLLVGGLLGFLFGIPRSLQQDRTAVAPPTGRQPEGSNGAQPRVEYQVNTNLEQISDWLTKILVGLGLTQITTIPSRIGDLAAYFTPAFGGGSGSAQFGTVVLVYALICGFLVGYLWTRLFLPGAFRAADLAALGDQVEAVSRQVERQADQQALDAAALALILRQLNASPGAAEVPQEELDKAVKAASEPVKIQIFNQAQLARSQNWRPGGNKAVVARTVPIFRALIADAGEQFHRNYAQLGYALKDKDPHDWGAAETALGKAIEIRDRQGEGGWLLYEFNRALSRMNLPQQFPKEAVLADLKAAAKDPQARNLILTDPECQAWMAQSGYGASDLA